MRITCTKCKQTKDSSEFRKDKYRKYNHGFKYMCKNCERPLLKKYYEESKPDKVTRCKHEYRILKQYYYSTRTTFYCIYCLLLEVK